jgi:preprotein translocase subunit SecF
MRKLIRFSKFFLPAAVLSGILAVLGITGYVINSGFNLGVDFQAGIIQEVRLAPTAFNIKWNGTSSASISYNSANIYIVITGAGIENRTYAFPFNEYETVGSITRAMTEQVEGLEIETVARDNINSHWLLFNTHADPVLSDETAFVVHFLEPESAVIPISEVRAAVVSFGQSASVQSMGNLSDRQFMIRVQDREEGQVRAEEITRLLEAYFGKGEVIVIRSDYVDSRLSKNLTDQIGLLVGLTLLLMLIYSSFRFKFKYAVALVVGIMYDALVVVGFVVWTRMEFTTSTIAAILTIIGYSTNNTIVVFDRIRETRRIRPEDAFVDVLDRSLTDTLSRTIITTVSTLIAVMCLFIFTTGSMKDFALALMVGMLSGVYTTTFIASGIVNFWERKELEKEKRKLVAVPRSV